MIYHSHWRQRTSRCLWRYGGSSCTRGQWFQNQTRPTRTSEPNRENKHCWWKPDTRQTEVWRGSAPSLEVSRRVTQTQKPSHLLQSGYEEHGQSHQMQHGYGDQQEDHGCLEMWENPWNSVYRQRNDLLSGPTGFRGRTQFLCLRELTSLRLSNMVSVFAVTLRGNCGITDPATSAPTISSYLQTQVSWTAAFTLPALWGRHTLRSVIGIKRKRFFCVNWW